MTCDYNKNHVIVNTKEMNHKIELEIIVISSVWLQIKSPVKSDEEQNSVMDLMVENEL